jgi:hypothetical protein
MATTFYAKDAPYSLVPNEHFDADFLEDYIRNPRNVEVSDWPELEVCAGNIQAFGQLINITLTSEMGTVGSLQPAELHPLMRRLIDLMTSSEQRRPMLYDDEVVENFFNKGVDDGRIFYYVTKLMEVVTYCIEHNRPLMWS